MSSRNEPAAPLCPVTHTTSSSHMASSCHHLPSVPSPVPSPWQASQADSSLQALELGRQQGRGTEGTRPTGWDGQLWSQPISVAPCPGVSLSTTWCAHSGLGALLAWYRGGQSCWLLAPGSQPQPEPPRAGNWSHRC